MTQTPGFCASYESGRLYYPPSNASDGLEVEILRTFDGNRIYLNTRNVPFSGVGKGILVTYTLGTALFETEGYVMKGRQRVLLPPADTDKILYALLNDCSVNLFIDCYKKYIPGANFKETFNKLSKVPR